MLLRRWGSGTNVWVDMVNWPPLRDSSPDVSSVSPSSEQMKDLWVVCGLYSAEWSCAIGGSMATWKPKIN